MTTLIHLPSRRVKTQKMEVKSHVLKEIILLQLHNQECQRGMTGEGQYEVEVMIQYSCEKKEQAKQGTADHRASRQKRDMNVEGRNLLMTKPDGQQRKQKMSNDYISRNVVEQAQVSENVLAAETHLREKFPNAGTRIQGTDLNARPAGNVKCARPAGSVNADEAADAADRAELSCDPKERGKGKIKASLQEKGR